MSKKTKPKTAPFTFSLCLDDDGTATIVTRRRSNALIHQFQYQTITDLIDQMHAATNAIVVMENEQPNGSASDTSTTTSRKESATPSATQTLISIVLHPEGNGTTNVRRGDYAIIRSFTYINSDDLQTTIASAFEALTNMIANPPIITDSPTQTQTQTQTGAGEGDQPDLDPDTDDEEDHAEDEPPPITVMPRPSEGVRPSDRNRRHMRGVLDDPVLATKDGTLQGRLF